MPRKHVGKLGLDSGRSLPHVDHGDDAHGYPRPMLRRREWTNLNGIWEFVFDPEQRIHAPEQARYTSRIVVPFAPETAKSGIEDTGFHPACWYRRTFELGPLAPDERVYLHFGAVDYEATVWVDGAIAGSHEGGYTSFCFDVTHLLRGERHELVVRALDDPFDLAKPRGKQDWQLDPHSIWYPRTTGIWQTVWLERVDRAHIAKLRWTPHLDHWEVGMEVVVDAPVGHRYTLAVRLHVGDVLFAEDRYSVVAGEVHRRIALSDPGIDDFRNEFLWSPSRPTLVDVELELSDERGRVVDSVTSYTALRSFAVDGDRFVLNGRPYPLRMVLDQGYWPDTGMTPPSDAALRRDVELTKAMGFNGARKHQKIEDPRYLYWADRLGLLVWEEMPSTYRFTRRSVERLTKQWMEAVDRDVGHPSVVAWVPFNESWGVPNLPNSKAERHWVESLYHLTKTLDPTRPVVGNDGWESVATDILGIHDYDADASRIAARYATPDLLPKILKRERPGGRVLLVDPTRAVEMPVVLSEFGGIAVATDGETWGYSSSRDASELQHRYRRLLESVRSLELLAGFCYTQLADTYQEANGLLTADRRPKFPLEAICAATSGVEPGREDDAPTSLAEIAPTTRGASP